LIAPRCHRQARAADARRSSKGGKGAAGDVEKGANPAFERRTKREAPNPRQSGRRLSRLRLRQKKTGTARGYDNALRLHILPQLGTKRLTKITHADVESLHASMSDRRPQANRTLAVLSAALSWAARHRHVNAASNPTKGVEKYRESAWERCLTQDELLRLSDALTAAETTGRLYSVDESNPKAEHAPKPENRRRKFDSHSVAAIRLLTLIGARLREILDAKWEHVDLERGMMFLPDSKTGRKPIYLSAAAAAILSALPRIDGNPCVIPGEKTGQPRANLKRPRDAICEVAGLDGVRLHDLSHSFASVGAGRLWDSRSSGSFSAIHSRPQHSATRILTLIDAARGRNNRLNYRGGGGRQMAIEVN
jgi:integrase